MSRVLALLGAVVLVLGAVLVRNAIDDDGEADDDGSALVIRCVTELREICEAIERPMELTIEPPAATIDAVEAGEDIDAWVTFDPWPAMAATTEEDRAFEGAVGVATSDLGLLARTNRIPDACGAPVTWTCLVDDLGDAVALPGPTSAYRPLVLGFAATDFFGPSVAANDLSDPDLSRRLEALDSDARDPLNDMRVGLPEPVATGIASVQLGTLGARQSEFTVSTGRSSASVAVVVSGPRADRITGEPGFTRALDAAGWQLQADATSTGLPRAGVLVALAAFLG